MDERFNIFYKYFTVSQNKNTTEYTLYLNDIDIVKSWPQDLHSEIGNVLSKINDYPEITAVDLGGDFYASADFNVGQENYLDSLFEKIMPLIQKSTHITEFKCEFSLKDELLISLLKNKPDLWSLRIFVSNNGKKDSELNPLANAINNSNIKNLELFLENKHFSLVTKILRENYSLNELTLINLSVNDYFQNRELASAIKENISIKKLYIYFDEEEITNKDSEISLKEVVASGLISNSALNEVEIACSLRVLTAMLRYNRSLKIIYNLNYNLLKNISVEDVQAFINSLYSNDTIKTIGLCLHGLQTNQFDWLDQTLSLISEFANICLLDDADPKFKMRPRTFVSSHDKHINLYLSKHIWQQFIEFSLSLPDPATSSKKPKLGL